MARTASTPGESVEEVAGAEEAVAAEVEGAAVVDALFPRQGQAEEAEEE